MGGTDPDTMADAGRERAETAHERAQAASDRAELHAGAAELQEEHIRHAEELKERRGGEAGSA